MNFDNRNFIIFSSIDWGTHWQIHHQLVNSIIDSGGRVLFVENTGSRSIQARDFRRIYDRIKLRIGSIHGYKDIDNNLVVYTPLFIPFPYSKVSIFINTFIIAGSIKKWINAASFNNIVCISFLPTPAIQNIIKRINPSLSIYYCADNMSRSLSNPHKLTRFENKFFKDVDIVFTTSHSLYERASHFSDNVHNIPAGIDTNKFPPRKLLRTPADIEKITHPIFGYIGGVGDVFDKNLIAELAKSLKNINIVIVGPHYTDVSIFNNISNVVLLGDKSHDLMPDYINSFDVSLIPYIVNKSTDSVYPCKLNEYLSLGKNVLSTNLQEVRIFNNNNNNNVVTIGVSRDDFINKARILVEEVDKDSEENKINRRNVAINNTWDNRFVDIKNAIDNAALLANNNKFSWRRRLIDKYAAKKILLKGLLTAALVFLLIFYSPLFSFIGQQLIVADSPRKTDAIVVFSGDGETSYRNLSYQNRALKAVYYYNKGYSNNIYLSSGREQTIADVEMIRLYLISKGVPDTSIHIFKKYPNSTYKNILMVKQGLDSDGMKSILFITAPYHSLRSKLIWSKNAPNIDVVSPSLAYRMPKYIEWKSDMDKIRVILYEYASIVYNWIMGRI